MTLYINICELYINITESFSIALAMDPGKMYMPPSIMFRNRGLDFWVQKYYKV